MTPNGVTRVNRLRRVGYATKRPSAPTRQPSAPTRQPSAPTRQPSAPGKQCSGSPDSAPLKPPAPKQPTESSDSVVNEDTNAQPDSSAVIRSKVPHVVPSDKYAPWQRRQFRSIWKALHSAAAARSLSIMSEAQFRIALKIASDRLEKVCSACHREFVSQVGTLVQTAPDAIERVMYDMHDSTTVQRSPPFDEIESLHRAYIADIVMRGIVRP